MSLGSRERQELANNREGLWEMYRIVNPPMTPDRSVLRVEVEAEHSLWLENGKIHITAGDGTVAMWASFRFFAPADIHVDVLSAQELDVYVNAGQLVLREAWLDGEPTNHRPDTAKRRIT